MTNLICKEHRQYKGIRKPTTKKDCACHPFWIKKTSLNLFDDVHILSKNLTGSVYSIDDSTCKVKVPGAGAVIECKINDLEKIESYSLMNEIILKNSNG